MNRTILTLDVTGAYITPHNNNGQVEMTSRQRREANLGIVLISISVIFIICQSVKIVPDLYEMIYCRIGTTGRMDPANHTYTSPQGPSTSKHQGKNLDTEQLGDCKYNGTIDTIIDISHLLLAINSSVNVIIYTLRGTYKKM